MLDKRIRRFLLGGALMVAPVTQLGCNVSVNNGSLPDLPIESLSESAVFQAPVQLKAGDKVVAVESPGYACPTMADVDGDGLEDLVVGQFKQGHMQFCRNIAKADQPPEFAAAEWLKTGDEKAVVPGVW